LTKKKKNEVSNSKENFSQKLYRIRALHIFCSDKLQIGEY